MKPTSSSLRLMKIFLATAVVALFINFRMAHTGDWLPTLPESIPEGAWSGINSPIPANILGLLGDPPGEGYSYHNPFNEWVSVSVIAAASFDAYHDPTVCSPGQGFFIKAETRPIIAPPDRRVRAMMMRNPVTNLRSIEYYWLQNDDGSTATEARMGTYRDIFARLQTGYGAVVQGHKTCLVRVFTFVGNDDKNGVQAHRNVLQVSRAIYRAMNPHAESTPQKVALSR